MRLHRGDKQPLAPFPRLGLSCLGSFCLLPGLLAAQATAPNPAGQVATEQVQEQDLLVEFGELLQGLRSGEHSDEAALLLAAQRLARTGREDALHVARFYVDLSLAARKAGIAGERRFYGIRSQVQAGESLRGEDWREVRDEVEAELQSLIETHDSAPDFTPAARAHALLARLWVSRLDRDGGLQAVEPQRLAEKATAHATSALTLFERAHQRTPQLEPIWLLGELKRMRGQTREARQTYEDLAQLAAHVGREDYAVLALRGLVCLAREAGDTRGVGELLKRWGALQTPQACWDLAREQTLWLLASDQAQAALNFLWKCKPLEIDQALQWKALSCSALRRRGHLTAARRTLQSMRADHSGEWELLTLTEALQLQAEGHHAGAEDVLQAESPFENWSAQGRVQGLALLGEVRLAQGQAKRALGPLRRALRQAQGWESRRLGPGSVSGEWLGLHAVVLAAQAAAQSGDMLLAAQLLEENQARHLGRALHDSLAANPSASPLRTELMDLRQVDAGVMTFAFGADFGLSVHLGPNGQARVHTIEWSRHQVQLAIQRLRQAILEGDETRVGLLAHELSSTLLAGMGEWTADQPLRLMLHGPLQQMPVALLRGRSKRLNLICNTTLWNSPKGLSVAPIWKTLTWRFLGAPDSIRFDKLPAAREELLQLSGQSPGSTFRVGSDLTPDAMHMAMTSSDAVHLATHLVVSPTCDDPLLEAHGLLLGDDQILCASTIRDWSPSLPLVYLGACASGSGVQVDGEGQLGLARALQAGGSRNLVVTLWPVSDKGSAEFGKAFHAALAMGLPPSQAVDQARGQLRDSGHPMRDWAGFVHLGLD